MKNSEYAKAIRNLRNQAIEANEMKGAGGSGGKLFQRNRKELTPRNRVPADKAPKRLGTENWSQSRLKVQTKSKAGASALAFFVCIQHGQGPYFIGSEFSDRPSLLRNITDNKRIIVNAHPHLSCLHLNKSKKTNNHENEANCESNREPDSSGYRRKKN